MKSLFMLLTLTVFTAPALAGQQESSGKCLEMYRTYIEHYEAKRLNPAPLLHKYADMCIPKSAQHNEPQYFKLLQVIKNKKDIITIKASLKAQELSVAKELIS